MVNTSFVYLKRQPTIQQDGKPKVLPTQYVKVLVEYKLFGYGDAAASPSVQGRSRYEDRR